jgi:hypothetical protein
MTPKRPKDPNQLAQVDHRHIATGEKPNQAETRYSPAKCIGAEKKPKIGNPDSKHISTSYVERSNLTMRMHMRRFTRLTNAFSKKVENHAAAIASYDVLQFRSHPSDAQGIARDGRRRFGQALGSVRYRRDA